MDNEVAGHNLSISTSVLANHDRNAAIFPGKQIISYVENNYENEPPRKQGIFSAMSVPPTPINGLKIFTEQVAGHLKIQEIPCFMLDDDGHILKLLDNDLKVREETFYERLFEKESSDHDWHELKQFVPRFYGTVKIIHEKKFCYLKMDNLVGNFTRPCIMDLKIGKRTYDPFAEPKKIERELIRYDYQAQLGYRITGFKVYKAKTKETELYDRFHCKRLEPHDMISTFSYFFDLVNFPERELLIVELLRKLKCLLKWFEKQKRIKFFCTSLLIAYDGVKPINSKNFKFENEIEKIVSKSLKGKEYFGVAGKKPLLETKFRKIGLDLEYESENCELEKLVVGSENIVVSMIDFAHTFFDLEGMSNSVDENYMFGLRTIIHELEQCLQ